MSLTFFPHSDFSAFLKPAGLALSPEPHVHLRDASSAAFAAIRLVGAPGDRPAEEAFAAFAREGVVVIAGSAIATDETKFLLALTPRCAGFVDDGSALVLPASLHFSAA